MVTSAQHVKDDGTVYTGHDLTSTVRRSYTFLDGWGRTLETHVPASDGTGGQTVTATHYNALGQTDWTSAPFWNEATASVLRLDSASGLMKSALVNPDPADLRLLHPHVIRRAGSQCLAVVGEPRGRRVRRRGPGDHDDRLRGTDDDHDRARPVVHLEHLGRAGADDFAEAVPDGLGGDVHAGGGDHHDLCVCDADGGRARSASPAPRSRTRRATQRLFEVEPCGSADPHGGPGRGRVGLLRMTRMVRPCR